MRNHQNRFAVIDQLTGFICGQPMPLNPLFPPVKARTRKTKGAGSRKAGLAMAFKLLMMTEKRWRKINSPQLVAVVHAGVRFPDGETRILPDMPKSSDSPVIQPVEATV